MAGAVHVRGVRETTEAAGYTDEEIRILRWLIRRETERHGRPSSRTLRLRRLRKAHHAPRRKALRRRAYECDPRE